MRAWIAVVLCVLLAGGLAGCSSGSGSLGGGTQQQTPQPPVAKAPTANAGGPYSAAFGTTMTFNGSASTDPQGQALTYAWSFGDNSTATGASVAHVYATAGVYTVSLTITNTSGLTGTATAKATVLLPPVAKTGGPYSVTLGTAITFSSAGSSDPQGQSLTYAWDFGDNTTATGASATHTYTSAAVYNVTLTVTDTSGLTGTATVTATATVLAPPVANAGGPYAAAAGTSISFNGTGSSDPQGQTLTYAWNFGDSTTGSGSSPTHTYASAGIYTVSLTVTDTSGLTGMATATASLTGGTHVTEISMPVMHIVWDAAHGSLYATLPNTGANANTVVAINPITATVGTPVAAGDTPDVLALSADDSFLYTALDGAHSIVRFNLPALTLDTSFNLSVPSSIGFGAQTAISMAVAPGSPHTIATIIGSYSVGPPNTGGTVIYDDTTARASSIPYGDEVSDYLAWGANASIVYATDTSSDGTLWVDTVSPSGIALTTAYGQSVESQTGTFSFDPIRGNIYSDDGHVVNPANGSLLGTFNLKSFSVSTERCLPDIANNVVFFLGETPDQISTFLHVGTGVTIQAFNATTYQLIDTISISGPSGFISDFVRWGNAGLAFIVSPSYNRNASGSIYLLDGSFVSKSAAPDFTTGTTVEPLPRLVSISPQSAAAGSGPATLTVTGSNLEPNASILWNGTPLVTNPAGASALQATVPSSDLATAGTAAITVSNGSGGSSIGSLAFTITSASPGTTNLIAVNLASLDIAWDSAGNQLIAPVWSADSQFPNSIVAIDPATGTVTNSVAVAADPTLSRITSDDSYVYTGFKAVNQVTQLALPGLTGSTSFSLGSDVNGYGPWYALDLQPAPGAPLTTAIILGSNGRNPEEGPLVLYNNGAQLPIFAAGFGYLGNTFDVLQWGANASTLYADENNAPINFYTLAANSSGVTLTNTAPNFFGGIGSKMHFDAATGSMYGDNGQVVNPVTDAQAGNFGASGLLVVDDTLSRVFILGQTTAQSGTANYTIQSFNQTTFAAVNSVSIAGVVGTPVALTRWGANGLAFVTYNQNASPSTGPAGMLYIISDTGFVNANQRSFGAGFFTPVHEVAQPARSVRNPQQADKTP